MIVIQTIEKININYLKELDKKVTLINLTYDIVFKSVFQRNKNLLKDYLNSLLNLNIKKESKITFLNNELYKENKDEYHKIVDLYLSINNQTFIDIELNKMPFEIVRERNNLYLNKLASMLLKTLFKFFIINKFLQFYYQTYYIIVMDNLSIYRIKKIRDNKYGQAVHIYETR